MSSATAAPTSVSTHILDTSVGRPAEAVRRAELRVELDGRGELLDGGLVLTLFERLRAAFDVERAVFLPRKDDSGRREGDEREGEDGCG